MKIRRRKAVALAVAAALIAVPAVALLALSSIDWNRARPWLDARTSEALGRPFLIAGDLSLSWDWPVSGTAGRAQTWRGMIPWPHLRATDIHIGNPGGLTVAAPADMARIGRVDFSLSPLALLAGRIVIPVLRLDLPVVNLRRGADGGNNWTFPSDDSPSPWRLELQSIVFSKGRVHLVDAVRRADLTADVDTLEADSTYGVAWQLRGSLNGAALVGKGKAGAVLSLQRQMAPFPIMASLRTGQTVITVVGTLTRPADLAALDMRLTVSGASMARLYALSGMVLPETPPFATEGHLVGTLKAHADHWVYDSFRGRVGGSDIRGSLDYQAKQPRALLSGTVVSRLLRFSDLAPMIGADSNASKTERGVAAVQPADKALPVEAFRTERWTSIDADISFSAEEIVRSQGLPINKLAAKLHLQDGVLSLLPLNFDMAGGSLSSNITLDGSGRAGKDAIRAEMKVTARRLELKRLFPSLQSLQASVGEFNGDASLSATGNSVASLLGASNGEIKARIDHGTVSKLLLEEMGLNIGNVILTRLVGDRQVKLNCLVSDFGVSRGLMQTHRFIIDTDEALLQVSGNISLAQERLDLTLKPDSKGLRVFSLRAPLYLRGSFKEPRLSVDKGVMAIRAGGALALAVLAPVAALLPLIKTGPAEQSDCTRLLAAAEVLPLAPAP